MASTIGFVVSYCRCKLLLYHQVTFGYLISWWVSCLFCFIVSGLILIHLESFHTRCQRRILNILWTDFVCNTASGQPLIEAIVRQRCLWLFSHVSRFQIQLQFLPTLLFVWHVTFEKGHLQILIGEDSKTWLHHSTQDTDLSRILIFHPNWLSYAQDRSGWRAYDTASYEALLCAEDDGGGGLIL